MTSKNRESHFDLLRILCCIAVVVIHVSSAYKDAITDDGLFGGYLVADIFPVLLYNTLFRFAVPCFVMLAGAFALGQRCNGEYRRYYAKTLASIGIPVAVFFCVYSLYSLAVSLARFAVQGGDAYALLEPVRAIASGAPLYHMWYMAMILPLYLLVPVLVRWKQEITQQQFAWTAVFATAAGILSGWTSSHTMNWDVGLSACYLGYFLLGSVIRERFAERPNNRQGVLLVILGVLLELCQTFVQQSHSLQGLHESQEALSVIGPMNPVIAVASILIFTGFSMLRVKGAYGRLARKTFLVYLFHGGVWDLTIRLVKHIPLAYAKVVIPCAAAAVFLLSLCAAVVYQNLWDKLEARFHISQRLCSGLKLQ